MTVRRMTRRLRQQRSRASRRHVRHRQRHYSWLTVVWPPGSSSNHSAISRDMTIGTVTGGPLHLVQWGWGLCSVPPTQCLMMVHCTSMCGLLHLVQLCEVGVGPGPPSVWWSVHCTMMCGLLHLVKLCVLVWGPVHPVFDDCYTVPWLVVRCIQYTEQWAGCCAKCGRAGVPIAMMVGWCVLSDW